MSITRTPLSQRQLQQLDSLPLQTRALPCSCILHLHIFPIATIDVMLQLDMVSASYFLDTVRDFEKPIEINPTQPLDDFDRAQSAL